MSIDASCNTVCDERKWSYFFFSWTVRLIACLRLSSTNGRKKNQTARARSQKVCEHKEMPHCMMRWHDTHNDQAIMQRTKGKRVEKYIIWNHKVNKNENEKRKKKPPTTQRANEKQKVTQLHITHTHNRIRGVRRGKNHAIILS